LAVLINNHSGGSSLSGDKMTIAVPRIVNATEDYRGFTISWNKPVFAGGKWTANVTSEAAHLAALLRRGVEIIEGRDCDQMIANCRRHIDNLFG
jgi:hypothetical protein